MSHSSVLNLFKDIGIGAAILIILGRLVKLVEVAIEFCYSLRLDLVEMRQAILDGLEQLV